MVSLFIGVLAVVLIIGLTSFLYIFVNVMRDKPVNETIARVTRPFLAASIIIIVVGLFFGWLAFQAWYTTGLPE